MSFLDWSSADFEPVIQGDIRTIEPVKTFEWVQTFASAMGITRVANITGLDRVGIPVTMACRPNSRSVAVSMGKGLSLAAAMASALMESVESFHAESACLPIRRESLRNLREWASQRGYDVIDVDRLQLRKPDILTSEYSLPWTVGTNILNGRKTWLPHELVHTDYRIPFPEGWGYFLPSSNGLASGNVLSEAVCHALCEIVERDCVWRWDHASIQERSRRRLDLTSITDERLVELLARLQSANLLVGLWDLTGDLPIPSYMCWIVERESGTCAVMGSGCHIRSETALARAITEAAQSRLTVISGARDDLSSECYAVDGIDGDAHWRKTLTEENPQRRFRPVSSTWSGSPAALADHLVSLIDKALYSQIVAVNLTNSTFNIPVVRIVIPGMMMEEA